MGARVIVRRLAFCVLTLALGRFLSGQELPRGEIVEDVQCENDASQHYALYLPSYFDASRRWPVILAFDAGGRGREGVERYRAAAEQYGYVVAGSKNSRNGPWNVGMEAAEAMMADISRRFPVDSKRMYTAGMSGGARVAIMAAQKLSDVAGVMASSAGYSTAFHKSERFPLFATVGTEDFNYRELRAVEKTMTSPHLVKVFTGGHTWPPSAVATLGVEWMEVQAIRRGLRPRDEALIDELFTKRMAAANAETGSLARMRELKHIADEFGDLRDVTQVRTSAAALERSADVAAALKAEQAEDAREQRVQSEVDLMMRQLGWPERAESALIELKSFVGSLLDVARQDADSSDRRIARRVLAGLRASRAGISDARLRDWLRDIQIPAPPQSR